MLTSKIRTGIAVLGAALTVTLSTAAVAPDAHASKNNGCNVACQRAIGKQVVIDSPCENLQSNYNAHLTLVSDYSLAEDYADSVNAAFDATKIYNVAHASGCAWAA